MAIPHNSTGVLDRIFQVEGVGVRAAVKKLWAAGKKAFGEICRQRRLIPAPVPLRRSRR